MIAGVGVVLVIGAAAWAGASPRIKDVTESEQVEGPHHRRPASGEQLVSWEAAESLIQANESRIIHEVKVESIRARLELAEHRLKGARRQYQADEGAFSSSTLLKAQARYKRYQAALVAEQVALHRASRKVDRLQHGLVEGPIERSITVGEAEAIVKEALQGLTPKK